MPSKPSALPERRTPAPSRPTRPRGYAPISTAETGAAAQINPLLTRSRSSTCRRCRSPATRSRQSSSASKPMPPSRPPHHVPQRSSRLRLPRLQPLSLRASQQRILRRQPRRTEHRLPLAASFRFPGREPTSLLRRQPRPLRPNLPLARSSHGLQSSRQQPIRPQPTPRPTPQSVPPPLPHRLPLLQAPQSPRRRRRSRLQNQ
jgi:hypothetical protein